MKRFIFVAIITFSSIGIKGQNQCDITNHYEEFISIDKLTHNGNDFLTKQVIETNKKNAIAFYKMAYLGNPTKAVELYVGSEYIQHNPIVADGKEAFIHYFTLMQQSYPNKSIEFVRAVAQEDLVALHTHQIWPGNDQYITMDFFRFDENGKIVEHWDSIQQIPNKTKSGNTMY